MIFGSVSVVQNEVEGLLGLIVNLQHVALAQELPETRDRPVSRVTVVTA